MVNIFNDVVEGITKEVSKVQERSQEMLQGFNINSQMRDLERKKGKKLTELGELIFNKYHNEEEVSEETIKEKVSEVVGYHDQITVLQAELDAANVQRDPNASQSKKAAHKAGYKATPGFSCPTCGTPASKDKKFCPACGGKLGEDTAKDSDPIDVEAEVDDEDEDKDIDSNGDNSSSQSDKKDDGEDID